MLKKLCPNCNVVFDCTNTLSCWCVTIPKLSKNQIDDQKCLCKDCLLKKYQKRIIDKIN